jgi:hypothetical protein
LRQAHQEEAVQLKQKALESQARHCRILDIKVQILVEYPDYKNPNVKGEEGAIYCENIINCYQANRRCRYSGISPLFQDPFSERTQPEQKLQPDPDEPEDTKEPAESDDI